MDYTREEALDVLSAAYASCGELLLALNEVNRDCVMEGVEMLDPEPLCCSAMSLRRSIDFIEEGACVDDVADDVAKALHSYSLFVAEFFQWKLLVDGHEK